MFGGEEAAELGPRTVCEGRLPSGNLMTIPGSYGTVLGLDTGEPLAEEGHLG